MGCFTPYYVKGIYVPCGKCYDCRLKKRQDWCFRMFQELRDRQVAFFVTLTYNDDNIPNKVYDRKHLNNYQSDNYYTLSKDDASTFLKTLQKNLRKKFFEPRTVIRDKGTLFETKKTVNGALCRYYLIGEYGDKCHITHGTNRPHYHAIIYFPKGCSDRVAREVLEESWSFGFVDIAPVTFADINYVAKHQFKECKGNDYQRKYAPIFATMSRFKGGLGSCYMKYLSHSNPTRNSRLSVLLNGYRIALPQFYRKKLFPDKMTDSEMHEFQLINNDHWHRQFAAAFGIRGMSNDYWLQSQAEQGSYLYLDFRQLGFELSNIRWRKYVRKKFSRNFVRAKLHERLQKNQYYVQYIQGKKTAA